MRKRDFLKIGAGFALGAGVTSTYSRLKPLAEEEKSKFLIQSVYNQNADDLDPKLTGSIWIIGNPTYSLAKKESFLTRVRLDDQSVGVARLPLENGHIVTKLNEELLAIGGASGLLVVDKASLETRFFQPSTPYRSHAGHPLVVGNYLLVPIRSLPYDEKPGELLVFRLSDFALESKIELPPNPHELCFNSTNKKIYISCYGGIKVSKAESLFQKKTPSYVSIFDSKNFQLIDQIEIPTPAPLAHMSVSSSGTICGTLKDYYYAKTNSFAGVSQKKGADTKLVFVDKNKKIQFVGDEKRQNNQRAICYNESLNSFFATFVNSNTVARVNANTGYVDYTSGRQLGLGGVGGICSVDKSPYLAVSGAHSNLNIFDIEKKTVLQSFKIPTFNATHISYS